MHHLLEHLTLRGAAETLLLLCAVWAAWIATTWTTKSLSAARVLAMGALCALIPLAFVSSALLLGALATAIVVAVAWSDTRGARRKLEAG